MNVFGKPLDGGQTSPRSRRFGHVVLLLTLTTLHGCAAARLETARPTVDQLMQQAIEKSREERLRQQAVIDGENAACELESCELQNDVTQDSGLKHPTSSIADPLSAHAAELLPPGLAVEEEAVEEGPINEEFIETDVREAVALLAAEYEADILMDDKVRGVVNVTIVDDTFDQALDKVLLPLGYVVGRRGRQYVIAPPDPKSPLFRYISTQVDYYPQHVKAKDLLVAPSPQMLQYVRLAEGTNALVVDAPTQYIDEILRRLRDLDRPVPQVELEAIICVVSPDSGFRFGLDWEHMVELGGETAFSLGSSGLGISASSSPKAYEHLFDDFSTTSAFVKLLAQHGYLTIRASPRVMAQDGGDATIAINRETFFSIAPTTAATGDNANAAFFYQQNIQKVESGIMLDIIPRIRGDEVTVEIKNAEVSEDIRTAGADVASNPYPVITRRKVATTVHVKDGKTIIIGGLVQRETVDRVSRIPGLSRIPGIGGLFQTVEQQCRDAEVVIFISPRIVRPSPCDASPEQLTVRTARKVPTQDLLR